MKLLMILAALMPSTLFGAALETKNMRARKGHPGMAMTAVYGELKNASSKPLSVVRIESPAAGHASFHETVEEGGLLRMKPLPRVTMAPGEGVSFVPGGKHIMLEKLNKDWSASGQLTLRFTFDDGSSQDLAVLIQENP